jgi:hypothetical protein
MAFHRNDFAPIFVHMPAPGLTGLSGLSGIVIVSAGGLGMVWNNLGAQTWNNWTLAWGT